MIIQCPCGKKKFAVKDNLIPEKGRNIQCGACDHVWFYKKPLDNLSFQEKVEDDNILDNPKKVEKRLIEENNDQLTSEIDEIINFKDTALIKYQKKSQFTFGKFLSYILVLIISFIGLILVLDTFKFQLYILFPSLEFLLFSLFETLKDINLFVKDLI